jgi:hypothetical protein
MGARPSIVSQLCGVNIRKARRIYGDVLGRKPPSGLLPFDKQWILRGSINCIHASMFFNSYRAILAKIGASEKLRCAHAFETAYGIYHGDCVAAGDAVKLEINRAYDIVRQETNGDLSMKSCATCQSNHLVLSEWPDQLKGCPLCHACTNVDGRVSWMNTNAMFYQKNGQPRSARPKKPPRRAV